MKHVRSFPKTTLMLALAGSVTLVTLTAIAGYTNRPIIIDIGLVKVVFWARA